MSLTLKLNNKANKRVLIDELLDYAYLVIWVEQSTTIRSVLRAEKSGNFLGDLANGHLQTNYTNNEI